jgi:hypothetical protein
MQVLGAPGGTPGLSPDLIDFLFAPERARRAREEVIDLDLGVNRGYGPPAVRTTSMLMRATVAPTLG